MFHVEQYHKEKEKDKQVIMFHVEHYRGINRNRKGIKLKAANVSRGTFAAFPFKRKRALGIIFLKELFKSRKVCTN